MNRDHGHGYRTPHPAQCTGPLLPDRLTGLLKALSDPVRIGIVRVLLGHEHREACVSDLITSFPQSGPTISHHLKVLHAARIITRRRDGTWLFYRLSDETLDELALLLGEIGIPREPHTVPAQAPQLRLA